jgi:hypothetical protein
LAETLAAAQARYASAAFASGPTLDSSAWGQGSELSLLFENLAAATPEMPRRRDFAPAVPALAATGGAAYGIPPFTGGGRKAARRVDELFGTADVHAPRFATHGAEQRATAAQPSPSAQPHAPPAAADAHAPTAGATEPMAASADVHPRRPSRPTATEILSSVPEASAAQPLPPLPPLVSSLPPAAETRAGLVKRDCSGKAALGKKTGSGRRPRTDSEAEAQRICAEMDELQSLLSGELGRELGADSCTLLNLVINSMAGEIVEAGLGADEMAAQMPSYSALTRATESQ